MSDVTSKADQVVDFAERGSNPLTRVPEELLCEQYPSYLLAARHPPPSDPQIRRQAIEWYTTLSSPERIEKLWPSFQQWLAEHPGHREGYLWVEHTCRTARELAEDCENDVGMEVVEPRREPRRYGRAFWVWIPVATGSAALLIAIVLRVSGVQAEADFQTERGKQKTVVLADHSVVTLNTNTRLHVRFTLMRRELELLRGQALFKVFQDHLRPFCVRANDATVSAAGTEFGMRLKEDGDVEAVVAQGNVTVDTHGDSMERRGGSVPSRIPAKEGDTIEITADGHVNVDHVGLPKVQRDLKWTQGKIALEQEPLSHWVEEFNRYNRRTLEIDDERIAQIPISGEFDASDPDSFVNALQDTYGIKHSVGADGVIQLRGK
jgi:transmembrane sensor